MKIDHCAVYQNKSGKNSWNTTVDGIIVYNPRVPYTYGIGFHTYTWSNIRVYVRARSYGSYGQIRSCPVIGDDKNKFYFYGLACWENGQHSEFRDAWFANNTTQRFFDNTTGIGKESIEKLNKHKTPYDIQLRLDNFHKQKTKLLKNSLT